MSDTVEPKWIDIEAVIVAQQSAIEKFRGSHGVRDRGLIESALTYPRNRFLYQEADWPELAAAYAFSLCTSHGFVDGNKRIAFATAYAFLRVNGFTFNATDKQIEVTMLAVAGNNMDEGELADWFAEHIA